MPDEQVFGCAVTDASVRVLSSSGGWEPWPHRRSGDSLATACRHVLGESNRRLPRLDAPTLAALLSAHVAFSTAAAAGLIVTDSSNVLLWAAIEHGSESADRAYWETAQFHGGALASPILFAATLPSSVVGELALTFGLRGPVVVTAGRAETVGEVPSDLLAAVAGHAGALVSLTLTGWNEPSAQSAPEARVLVRRISPSPGRTI